MLIVERRLTQTQLKCEPHEPFREAPFGCEDPELTGQDGARSLVVIDVVGELTDPSGVLHPRVQALMEQDEQAIVFNLAQVTGWDSTGLGELIRCYTTVVRSGRRFGLINAPRRFRRWVAAMKFL